MGPVRPSVEKTGGEGGEEEGVADEKIRRRIPAQKRIPRTLDVVWRRYLGRGAHQRTIQKKRPNFRGGISSF